MKLYHRQIYKYGYHRAKLAMLREGREHRRFSGVADFLERVPLDCPYELFHDSERASQTPLAKMPSSRLIVVEKENFATRATALVIPTVGDNRLRHEALQRFMLANDSTTLAIEVPIWITPETIADIEREHCVSLLPDGASGSLTGHIDFLQVRNGAVHILDYKPDARTNRPIAQLTIYALALSKLAGLRLFRHQVRVVQRRGVLRIFSADAA
ncbi:MAG TPA: PD-(D/E)XK nuclease family protein [Stellaceae bacterium]|nr:PD-(D/E)XK nuclease family protein [Stellaceae bacterium]